MDIKAFSWTVNGNRAYKKIDKSAFKYNSTGIPKNICKYWEAEHMSNGEKKSITLIVDTKEYSAVVEKREERIRLYWNSTLKYAIFGGPQNLESRKNNTVDSFIPEKYFAFEKLDSVTYSLERVNGIELDRRAVYLTKEGEEEKSYIEGRRRVYYTSRYERKPECRNAALRIHGYKCSVCGFDFEAVYGDLGKEYIEIHHKKPLHSLDEEIEVNPVTDLAPVCSNCHRMLHRRKDRIVTIEELRHIIRK